MSVVKATLAIASLVVQLLFFVGVAFLISDLYGLRFVVPHPFEEDPMVLVSYVLDTVFSYWQVCGIGLLGATLTFVLVTKAGYRAAWYLNSTRVLSWLWMPLIPIGTVIGIVLLRSASRAAKKKPGDH